MEITIGREDQVPTRHSNRVIHPYVVIKDVVQSGETPYEASRRINLMVNTIYAKTLLDQLGFTDRMVDEGTEVWCNEYLSSVASDHPITKPNVVIPLAPELKSFIDAISKRFEETLLESLGNQKK